MSAYDKITRAFAVFAKYDHTPGVAAEHDLIYAGPDPDEMSPDDVATVEALGWHREGEYECWGLFT
jgi:hypothetical protein